MSVLRAHAKVTVTIEVPVGSTWGPDCNLKQVHAQAKEDALHAIQRWGAELGVKIVSSPKVSAIIVEEA